jgi:hypothetical protein
LRHQSSNAKNAKTAEQRRDERVRRARTFAMFALFVILRGSWTGMQRHTHFSALFALSAFLL